jgi:MraZ protein
LAFRGTYDLTLDAKNRLTVPSKLRASFADGVVLALGLDRCAALWRPADYEAFGSAALDGLHPLSDEHRKINRSLMANSFDTELDGAGRVMIPPILLERAGLDREVVVAGAGSCLEIWDRTAYREMDERTLAELPELTARFGHTP